MRFPKRQLWGIAFSALTLLIAMNNCDNVRLSLIQEQTVGPSKIVPTICALPPSVSERNTKILFVVDMSGSNLTGNAGSGGVGTDPDKSYRYNLMRDFVKKHEGNEQIYYGLIGFQDSGALAFINDGAATNPIFTNDVNAVYGALEQFRQFTDRSATPYRASLTLAQKALSDDRQKSSQFMNQEIESTYSVVMLSDGVPTDYNIQGATGVAIDENAIDSDVNSIIVTAGQATLSTIYYGPFSNDFDRSAAARLERMAKVGNGYFSNVNIDGKVPLEQVIAFRDGDAWVIRRFMVKNLTSAPCDDGTIDADSDADGLCDRDETRYNNALKLDPGFAARMAGRTFSPTRRNSFANAYNDYINYRSIVYGESLDAACGAFLDADGDLLNTCEEAYLRASTHAGPTASWTSLMGSTGDPENFDSDGDGFIDYVELVFGRSRSAALDFNSTLLQIDGFRMDEILSQHRNPSQPTRGVAYEIDFHFDHVNEKGQNCYTYDQKELPLYLTKALAESDAPGAPQLAHAAGMNVLLIYSIQSRESDPNGAGYYFRTYQQLPFGTKGADIDVGALDYLAFQPIKARVKR